MRLGLKFSLTTSLVVAIVLASYGYHTVSTRRKILLSRMEREARAIARTAKIHIEQTPYHKKGNIRTLVDGIAEFEKTLGVFVSLDGRAFQSKSLMHLPHSLEKNKELGKQVTTGADVIERFDRYGEIPVFVHFEPLRGREGEIAGVLGIVQHTSFVETDIWATQLAVILTTAVLIALITASIFLLIRLNITGPISDLVEKIRKVGMGDFGTQVSVDREDELGELASEFNQMAANLKEAEHRVLEQAEKRAQLEQNVRHMERLATVGQLAAGVAHEIGTPLNVIGGRAHYLKKKVGDRESLEKNLEVIMRQSGRITKIIKRLLNFSRMRPPQRFPTRIPALIGATLDLLEYRTRRHKVRVVQNVPQDLPPVEADPDQLQQVFLNVALNAIQAMPHGGEMVFEGSVVNERELPGDGLRQQWVEIELRDTGIGMNTEVLRNIFKPFFTTKGNGTGTGLGLPISHGIVRDHGGHIDVHSEEGIGTTVCIRLPALSASARMTNPRSNEQE